jgi:hypothetical protein
MTNIIRAKAAPILFGIFAATFVGTLGACAVALLTIVPMVTSEFACGEIPAAGPRPGIQMHHVGLWPAVVTTIDQRMHGR